MRQRNMSTKRLARELGLIRKHSQSSGAQKDLTSTQQLFSYLIVIDFESTCWREKNNYRQEIIEFPAVLLNTSNGEIESEFHSYVQPQEHPVLSEFCTELTGITQKQVEAGLPLWICLSRFTRWLHTLQQEKGVVCVTDHTNTAASGHLCTFLTWSDWDLGVCLLYECKRKQISKPEALNSWIDLRATYRTFYSRKPKGLNGALQDLGIEFSGREHSGLDDARNTARLAWRMMTDGCLLKVTKSLNRAPLRVGPLFKEGRVHSKAQADVEKQPSCSGNHSNRNNDGSTHSSVCQSLVTTRTILGDLTALVCVNKTTTAALLNTVRTSPSDLTLHPETVDSDWSEGFGESGSYDDVLLEDEDVQTHGYQDSADCVLPSNANSTSKSQTDINNRSESESVTVENSDYTYRPHPSTTFVPVPYRLLVRPGQPCTTPSMPFTIYTDQSHQTSSNTAGGPFKVPHSVLSSSIKKSKFSTSNIQSKRSSISNNQSHCSLISINQSQLSCPANNHSELSSISANQSLLSSCSKNQSHSFSTTNQSLHSSFYTNQSVVSSSANQSKLSSISISHSSSEQPAVYWVSSRSTSKTSKVTAPLCVCGRRAKRLTVCNGGPNNGRPFYTCPIRKNGSGPAHRGGCGFFKWESAVINSLKTNWSFSFSATASRNLR